MFLVICPKKVSNQGGAKGTKRGSSRVESKRRWTESGLLPRLHLTNPGIIRVEHQFDCSIKSGPVEPSYLMHIWARLAASSASNKIVWLVGINFVNHGFDIFEQFCCWVQLVFPTDQTIMIASADIKWVDFFWHQMTLENYSAVKNP